MSFEAKLNFTNDIAKQLKEKKNLSDSSIKAYMRNLQKLNKDEPFKNFNFLKDTEVIERRLDSYKENTKRNYLVSIVSVLSIVDKPSIKKLHKKYFDLMMKKSDEINKETNPNEMTETQEKNWMSWDDIKTKHKSVETNVMTFTDNKTITESQYNTLLSYIILSLYVYNPPRRNKDYQIMDIVFERTPELDKSRNYLDLTNKQFVFNDYKTSSKYGTQIVPISEELWSALKIYFKFHPLFPKKLKKDIDIPFLVYHNKSPLNKVNSITRILNKLFDKAIGSSMLRHIYLTGKYGGVLDEQKKDASNMAHSESQQKEYIKKPKKILVSFK